MSLIARDPETVKRNAWKAYDASALSQMLRYDTWPAEIGICLLCDIDANKSEEQDFNDFVDMVDILPEDKPLHRIWASVVLLSEESIYKLVPAKSPDDREVQLAIKYVEARSNIEQNASDIVERMKRRYLACTNLWKCWAIYNSNPDHLSNPIREPQYFLSWAANKGIEIPWLEWATKRRLVDIAKLSRPLVEKPLDQRQRNSYLVIIAALCKELGIDPERRGISKKVVGLTQDLGCPLSDQTVRDRLKELPDAVALRMKS